MAPKKRTTRLNPETTTTTPTTTSVTNAQLKAMIDQGVTAALAARDANTNGVDIHNSRTGVRRNDRATRECTYPDFMRCQPLNFKGTEGVVELTQWVEKMETVFCISNCSVENQINFSTCTLLGNALTWWNSYVRTVGNDVAYAMTWTELKKKMTNNYCPRTEIKMLKVELWDLKMKGTNVIGYNQRFQELALLCVRMFLEESDKIERYVGGLPNMIHESVVASKPKTMQEATEIATELMDKRIRTFAKRTGEKKLYGGSKPLFPNPANANTANNQRVTGTSQKPTCYECGAQGHFKRECPKLNNNNNRGCATQWKCMPIEMFMDRPCRDKPRLQHRDSFDRYIGMDWLVKVQSNHLCVPCKIVRFPRADETLIVHDDRSNLGKRGSVWICQISQENRQKRTRDRMSDHEAKENHASAFYKVKLQFP
ncbi:reverse transcriptase domain-containing protein, partial [Tanacetum coccineum]